MKSLLIIPAILLCACTHAQVIKSKDAKTLPPFNITLADGSHYRVTDLPMGKPVMIVYFDPDCEHCETFISQMMKHADAFKNSQVVLVTYVPVKKMKAFIQKAGIEKYPSFIVGTEGESFIVRYHYDVIQFPYVALHNADGSLIATYESEVPPPADLAKLLGRGY